MTGDRALVLTGPRRLEFEDLPHRPLAANELRVRTLYSGISAGTELSQYRATSPFMSRLWDPERRVFRDGGPSWAYPVRNLGYEEVGEVVEAGPEVADLEPGDRIFGTWGHRTGHVLAEAELRGRLLPRDADPRIGIFSHIGAVALNGVHDARLRIGDLVVVFGLGVPGQIVLQAAIASGATVIGVDPVVSRRVLAERIGAASTLDPAAVDVADAVKDLTGGAGADVCIEVSGAAPALAEAMRSVAYAGRVVAMGFYQGETARVAPGRGVPPQPDRADLEPDLRGGARGEPPLEQAAALADGGAAAARGPAEPPAADHRHGTLPGSPCALRTPRRRRPLDPAIGADI